jgi:putative aldouronate transport system substrate-binding protein
MSINNHDRMNRRAFIRLAGVGATLSALSACSPAPGSAVPPTRSAPSRTTVPAVAAAPTTAPTVVTPKATPAPTPATAKGVLPTFVPIQGGPNPDFRSAGPLYEDGFINYPNNPAKSWQKVPPGNGGSLMAVAPALYPPPTPFDQNPAWQAVNAALNTNFQFNNVPQADYATRINTLMAGNDLPEFLFFTGGLTATAGLPQFLQAKAADLTPYLAADAIQDYPNLAAIPSFAWQNSGSIYQGHIYMIPLERYAPGTILFRNENIYDKEIGPNYVPKSADDFKRVLRQLNRPQENRWATGAYNATNGTGIFNVSYHAAMFGAPNNWRLNPDGSLTKDYETDEFKAAVAYTRDLYAADLFHPNSLQYQTNNLARYDYQAGKFVVYPDGFGAVWNDLWRTGLSMNPPVNFLMIPPFPAFEGGKPAHYLGPGYLGTEMIHRDSPERVQELLRILDFLAAPFGSQEDATLTLGVHGVDYNLDANGNPVLTDRGNPDANYVPWKYVMQHPQVMYVPDIPGYAKAEYEAEHILIPIGVQNPTLGYFSPTLVSKGTLLARAVGDGMIEIITGRRPIDDWGQVVADWQTNGGNRMRGELQQAMAASR